MVLKGLSFSDETTAEVLLTVGSSRDRVLLSKVGR